MQPVDSADQPMPQSPDAERCVLGAALIDPSAFSRCAGIVTTADFHRDSHRLIWAAMAHLSDAQAPIDLLTLKEALGRRGELDKAGGSAFVSSLVDGIPDVANVERYAWIVREKAKLRAVIAEGNGIMHAALDGSETADEIAAASSLRMTTLAADRSGGPVSLRASIRRVASGIEARSLTGEHVTGIPFGIPSLDASTNGMQRGVESMIAARPGVGKTALAIAIALHNAMERRRVLLVELDMNESMVGGRMLAAVSGVPYDKIRSGQFLTADEWRLIAEAQIKIESLDEWLSIDYTTHNLAKIAALIRHEARKGLDLVLLDHVGHVTGAKAERRDLEVGMASRRLLDLAAETNAAVVPLVQLKRDSANREPELSDLAESGKLEQDARLVVMLDRPFKRGKDENQCLLHALVLKNEGEAGFRKAIHFDGDRQRVSEFPMGRCRFCSNPRREVYA